MLRFAKKSSIDLDLPVNLTTSKVECVNELKKTMNPSNDRQQSVQTKNEVVHVNDGQIYAAIKFSILHRMVLMEKELRTFL